MSVLEVKDLHVSVQTEQGTTQILKGVDLVVNPGYALDCCGNDIVLPCPYTLNVNAMARDALLKCAVPCPGLGDASPREYLLYILYDEVAADLISPYSPEGNSTCENSRVEETCRFELRCPPLPKPCGGLLERVEECMKIEVAPFDSDELGKLQAFVARVTTLKDGKDFQVQLTKADLDDLEAVKTPDLVLDNPKSSGVSDAARDKLEKAREALRKATRTYARFLYAGASAWKALEPPNTPADVVAANVTKAKAMLVETETKLDDLIKQVAAPVRLWADAFSDTLKRLLRVADDEALPAGEDIGKAEVRQILEKQLVGDEFAAAEPYTWERYRGDLALFNRLRLQALLAPRRPRVHDLDDEIRELHVPPDDDRGFPTEHLERTDKALAEARSLFENASRDCICAALNPPCSSCDDLGVLLACVTVEECEIVKICNLVRKIVLSPAAAGYYLPVNLVLETICCSDREEQERMRARLAMKLNPLLQAFDLILRPASSTNTPWVEEKRA